MDAISSDWAARADLPQHVVQMVANFPNTLHPMSQFSAAITAMQMESKFARAYAEGLNKNVYWEVSYQWLPMDCSYMCYTFPQYTFDDAMDLIAKLPTLASIIYRNTYYDGKLEAIDPKRDWSANFARMLGYTDPQFTGMASGDDVVLVLHILSCCRAHEALPHHPR